MTKILFVCHGNICRSPMAEFIMKKLVRDFGHESYYEIDSAATSYEEIWNGIGNPIYGSAARTLSEHGIPYDKSKRARHINKSDYSHYDLLIGMDHYNLYDMVQFFGGDPEHKIHLMLEYTSRNTADVADPWYSGDFNSTWDDLLSGCIGLLKTTSAE